MITIAILTHPFQLMMAATVLFHAVRSLVAVTRQEKPELRQLPQAA